MSERTIAHLQRQIDLFTLKLNALLSVSSAINHQESLGGMLKAYEFVIKEQLGFRKHLLLSDYNGWKVFIKSGTKVKTELEINIEHLLKFKELTFISESNSSLLNEFEAIIPVIHGGKPLAYLLISAEGKLKSNNEHLEFAKTLTNLICVAIENRRMAETIRAKEVINFRTSDVVVSIEPSFQPKNGHFGKICGKGCDWRRLLRLHPSR
jgi:sigma-B regulation protein RsbU (phosphoserine phosphatase)